MKTSSKRRFSLKRLKWLVYQTRFIEKDIEKLILKLRESPIDTSDWHISSSLCVNIENIKVAFGESSDLTIRQFIVNGINQPAALVFIDNMVNKLQINSGIIDALLRPCGAESIQTKTGDESLAILKKQLLSVHSIVEENSFSQTLQGILSGQAALFIEGSSKVLLIEVRGWEIRAITEPETEAAVNAPREGFNETLTISISQIRRRIKDINLTIKTLKIGQRSQTDVAIVFIKGIVNPKYVIEAFTRLGSIEIDRVLGSGDIESLIEDHPGSPFPQVMKTERPDKIAAALSEGQVAILIDGTPIVMIIPATLPQFFQTLEDYNEHWSISSVIRINRYISILLSLTLPALYIAIVGFHPGIIPSDLAFTIGKALSNIPFPVLFEALFMVFALEILQEAGLRLPKPIGPTVGIVGGIVIGDAAVRASLVSPVMVVVIALTAITAYAQPSYSLSLAIRLARIPLMVAASMFGLYGLVMGLLILLTHLASLQSFGVPYLAPLAPLRWSDVIDTLFRQSIKENQRRPKYLDTPDSKRK